jgi:transcriptional regulator with XRE-family HTH domain
MEAPRRVIVSALPKAIIWSGALVKKKREELGISKANLAKALNTSPQNIHNWEAKNVQINSVHWQKLEKAFAAKDTPVVACDALPGIETKDLVPVPTPKPTMANKDPDVVSVTACDLLREIKAVAAMLRTGGMEQERIDRLLSWREDDAPLLQIALDKYVSAFKKAHETTEMFLTWFNEADTSRTEIARSVVCEINATEKANNIEKSVNAQG